MKSQSLQGLVKKIFADEKTKAQFLKNPESVLSKFGLTDQEKKDFPIYKEIGGYLKTLSYKEAWAAGWAKATKEQKEWYQSLPNFSATIFEEITGISVNNSLIGKTATVEIDGRKYRAKIEMEE